MCEHHEPDRAMCVVRHRQSSESAPSLPRVPSRLPCTVRSHWREMRFAPLRPLLERAADCPNADTARSVAVTGHRPRSVHSFRPPMPAMKTAKSHCSGSSGMRTWLGGSLGLGLGLGLGRSLGLGLGLGLGIASRGRDRVRARVGLGVGIGLRGRDRV